MHRKIKIIQPAVPHYRTHFFDKLGKTYRLAIYTTDRDFLGVVSIKCRSDTSYQQGFIKLGPFFWHQKLPIKSILSGDDPIIINGNIRILNYMLILLIGRLLGKEIIWWGHLNSAGSYGIASKLRQKVMRLASKRLLYTEAERSRYKHRPKTFAINNGLKTPLKSPLKPLMHFNHTKPLSLFFIGRLTEKSNIEFTLNTLLRFPHPMIFHIIGDGPSLDLYKRRYHNKRFIFHGELYKEGDIYDIAKVCHLFLYTGSVGLSLIQAFGLGLPALIHSNSQNHMPEFGAANERNAIFFEEGNETDLLQKLDYYYQLPASKKYQLQKQAYQTVQESFNVDDMVDRMTNCIEFIH